MCACVRTCRCQQAQAGNQGEDSPSQPPRTRPWSLPLGNSVSGHLPEIFSAHTWMYVHACLFILECLCYTHFSVLSVLTSQSHWEITEGSFKVIYAGHEQSPTHGASPWHCMVQGAQQTPRLPTACLLSSLQGLLWRKPKLHPVEEVL